MPMYYEQMYFEHLFIYNCNDFYNCVKYKVTYTVMFVYCTVQFRGILDFSSLDLIPVYCVLFIRNSLYVHVLLIIKENCFENFSCSALSRTALNILPDSFGLKRTLFFSVQTSLESCNIKVFKVFRAIQYRPEKLADTNT